MRQFGRFRNTGKPRRLLLGIQPIPTMVTLGNLLCGFTSIVLAMRAGHSPTLLKLKPEDYLYWSGIFIFWAMIFDIMDGKVARWTKSASRFGMELDSLCDVVSFGAAPAVLVYALIDHELAVSAPFQNPHIHSLLSTFHDRYYILSLMAVYVCCAAMRLARYNVEAETGHRDFFFGIPSPGAAGCVASLAVLIIPNTHHHPISQLQNQMSAIEDLQQSLHGPVLLALPFVMMILGVLMMTRVHYPHIGDQLLRGRKSFMHVMVLGLSLVLIIIHHEIALALAFNGYMIFGLLNEVRYQLFPSQRPAEWISAAQTTVPVPTDQKTNL